VGQDPARVGVVLVLGAVLLALNVRMVNNYD